MSFVLVPVLVVFVGVFAGVLYQAFKWSTRKRVKHPTVWEQYLESERRKQEERDRE
jgi:Tfp pilus assembly protein PilV